MAKALVPSRLSSVAVGVRKLEAASCTAPSPRVATTPGHPRQVPLAQCAECDFDFGEEVQDATQ
eukprot:6570814-Alexandrium_andersonii.AAC.1